MQTKEKAKRNMTPIIFSFFPVLFMCCDVKEQMSNHWMQSTEDVDKPPVDYYLFNSARTYIDLLSCF
jgi:hypothetical protein